MAHEVFNDDVNKEEEARGINVLSWLGQGYLYYLLKKYHFCDKLKLPQQTSNI